MLTLKLSKGSWAPYIQYPEGASSSSQPSVMSMTDAECLQELSKLAYGNESQCRETIEDEFPCLSEWPDADEDPYETR